MTACEKCWIDAWRRAYSDTSKTQSEHYMDLLKERENNPCTPEEQRGDRDNENNDNSESPEGILMYLPIEPKPQIGKFGKTYKDNKQEEAEEYVMDYLKPYIPEKPFECPLELKVVAEFRIPKSKSVWWKEAVVVDIIKHTTTPDLNNLVKLITDVMQIMGFYLNDKQIINIHAKKRYALNHGWHIHLIPVKEPATKKEYQELTLDEFEADKE